MRNLSENMSRCLVRIAVQHNEPDYRTIKALYNRGLINENLRYTVKGLETIKKICIEDNKNFPEDAKVFYDLDDLLEHYNRLKKGFEEPCFRVCYDGIPSLVLRPELETPIRYICHWIWWNLVSSPDSLVFRFFQTSLPKGKTVVFYTLRY